MIVNVDEYLLRARHDLLHSHRQLVASVAANEHRLIGLQIARSDFTTDGNALNPEFLFSEIQHCDIPSAPND